MRASALRSAPLQPATGLRCSGESTLRVSGAFGSVPRALRAAPSRPGARRRHAWRAAGFVAFTRRVVVLAAAGGRGMGPFLCFFGAYGKAGEERQNELFDAATGGDVAAARAALDKGANKNRKNAVRGAALHAPGRQLAPCTRIPLVPTSADARPRTAHRTSARRCLWLQSTAATL
jgi:hypothetical protein